jgi:lysophospholipase L1-like esterase
MAGFFLSNGIKMKYGFFGFLAAAALATIISPESSAQNIAWDGAVTITGDANLLTNGVYFDALIPDHGPLTADGVVFDQDTAQTSSGGGDGKISYVITSGSNNSYGYNTLFTGGSADFNAVMNAGGTFQFGGAGAGTVTISGLTSGHNYQIQVFNYAGDGDAGLTTFSGSPSVEVSTEVGGIVTQGQFATGTFTASGSTETFNWNGNGSSYTVLGAISVRDLTAPVNTQTIAWGAATGITGDANLLTNGVYFDALMLNTSISSSPSADGVTFNVATSLGGGMFGDGKISYAGNALINFAWANNFPVSASASSAFATVMDDGGIFQNGGSGTGTVTISGLTAGRSYAVQVFNYAPDGDAGLTTLSGTTPVTLSNLPGPDGNGQYTTGTFTADGATETFDWIGAGSSYTVLGAISVREMTADVNVTPTNIVNQGDLATLTANAYLTETPYYQWQSDNGSGGATWRNISGANASNYVVNTSALAVGNYEYQVIVTNDILNVTSAPVTLTVLAPSAPVVLQNPTPISASPYVGQSVTFTSAFTGNHPITNQWQFSTDGGATFLNLAGATNTTLSLNNLQLTNSGEYRLVATNAYGSNHTTPATVNVQPWSAAQIQWSAPVPLLGMTVGQILTNVPGSYLEGAVFFFDSFIGVSAGSEQFVFRSDGVSASISSPDSFSGEFVTNAVYGSGALGMNTTDDTNFDFVLNQYYDGGGTNLITLHNLVAGQQYSVQLFVLDNRSGMSNNLVNFADTSDTNDVSATFTMGDNAYVLGTFTATGTDQVIQENLLTGGFGNINALVVRALSYAPSVKPAIVLQPRQRTSLSTHTAVFSAIADGAPAPGYQWKAGPVGGPYTNLTDNDRFSGTTTRTLSVLNITTNGTLELVVAVTNSAGGVVSSPVDMIVPPLAQPGATAVPIRITCVGASDVSSPTPYGTPNWPDYIAGMLGYEYTIINCGASGTTMIKQGNAPYWNTQQYTNSLNSSPDIVIIMLGSNDSKPYNWIFQTNYVHDYETLINEYRNLPSHPRIYLNTLLTVYGAGNYDITDPIVTGELCPMIKQIAFDENLPIIDINSATKNMPQNFPDNVHPNITGAKAVAQTIFNGLMNAGETAPMVDEALNRPAFASSVSNGNGATNAVDNDWTTYWSSASTDNEWIYVDLGSTRNVTGVYLNWGANYGKSYKIQISNDPTNWTDVYTTSTGTGGINRISISANARYVRMLGLLSGTGNGYDLLDFTITVVAPAPILNINQTSRGNFNLSWPVSSTSFALEESTSLLSPVSWTQITNITTILDGSNYTTITPGGNNMFFRLKQLP